MYTVDADFSLYHDNKADYYQSLVKQLASLLSIDSDPVTNMAQTAAFIFHSVPGLNWAGFYTLRNQDTLLLGPYQGKVACVHIKLGAGVCGTAAAQGQSLRVDNVHEFDGHIACDAASNSEIVIPLIKDGRLIGVLDLDSPELSHFDEQDLAGVQSLSEVYLQASAV